MPRHLTSLLADLQRVVREISDAKGREESQPAESETGTHEPDTAPASNNTPDDEEVAEVRDLIIKVDGQPAGLVVGVEKNNTVSLESVEVTPEPDGRTSIMIRAKKE